MSAETNMLSLVPQTSDHYLLSESIHADVSGFLYDAFSSEDGLLGNLDAWTQRKVTLENLAKVGLVLEAGDPAEFCYQNLIREIDTEAETGIYLLSDRGRPQSVPRLAGEPGVSGQLAGRIAHIAPILFADALAHSDERLDLVWVTIRARYQRARADADVSSIILGRLTGDEAAADISNAMRGLLYAFHEDATRRQCGLPLILNDCDTRELVLMVSALAERAGSYAERIGKIACRAGTQ